MSIAEPGLRADFGGFRAGLMLLAEGIRFLRRAPRLWPLAMVPVFFAVCFVGAAVWLFASQLDWVHQSWVELLPALEATDWWTWIWIGPGKALFWLLAWLAVALAFAVSIVAGLLLANLASAPFLDLLSQRVEALALGHVLEDENGIFGMLGDVLKSFFAELQRLGFLATVWLGLSLAGFIVPGAHLITAPLLIATTVLFLPLDYAGFALDRRQVRFRDRRRWLWENLSTMSGFGGVAFVACLVPGLNLLILPALVTAGTLLVLRVSPAEDERSSKLG